MSKRNKGITLIALVVTIIVLLILAGVTIAMVLGQDGIFKKAQTAKEMTAESQEIEVIKLAINTIKTNDWENKVSNKEWITTEELKAEIENQGYTAQVNGANNLTVKYTNPGASHNTYLVTQEGKVTKQEETTEQTATIGEMFDRNGENELAEGYDDTKLHIGDFVTYDAGIWTESEMKAIKTGENNNLQQANNSSSLPNSNFQFGGFTVGASRNANAVPYNVDADYIKEQTAEGAIQVTGWRIYDVDEQEGEVTLISAGCPEDYYHPTQTNGGYISEYILSGNINRNWKKEDGTQMDEQTAKNLYTKRDWREYINSEQGATKANVLTKKDLDNWYKRNKGYANADVYNPVTFQSIYNEESGRKYETLIDNNAYHYIAETGYDNNILFILMVAGKAITGNEIGMFGTRVLVTLPIQTIIKQQPIGTKTLIDPRDSSNKWTYNVWELR